MKRLMIAVIVVVMSVSGQALAGSWAGVLGNYPRYGGGIYGGNYGYGGGYGYGVGGIISEIGRIQVANRVIDLAEKQQRQQVYVIHEAPVNNQYFEDVRIRNKIRELEDTNQRLRNENAEVNKKLDDMQKKLDRIEKALAKQK